jgi:hypothetical protein
MKPQGTIARPVGSHRDRLVLAAIEISNQLAAGHALGAPFEPPTDPTECATIANDICDRFYRKQAPFLPKEAPQLKQLAERLHDLFLDFALDDLESAVPKVNALLAEHPTSLHLSATPPYSLHYHDHSLPAVLGWQVGCSAAIASWVSSRTTPYIKRCEAMRCDRVFFDDTRNGSRRFCSGRCQTRFKVRAYRLRQAFANADSRPHAG